MHTSTQCRSVVRYNQSILYFKSVCFTVDPVWPRLVGAYFDYTWSILQFLWLNECKEKFHRSNFFCFGQTKDIRYIIPLKIHKIPWLTWLTQYIQAKNSWCQGVYTLFFNKNQVRFFEPRRFLRNWDFELERIFMWFLNLYVK